MNKTNDFKYNLPAYSDPVDIEDLNDNFRGIDDALMAGLCKKDYTGNNMGSSDPSARKYAWAPWLEIVNDNEFDVVVTDRNAPVESEEATINVAAGQTFRKYINGRYYMNFYVQDQHDVTFKWFTNAETYINESGGGGGGTGTVTSVSVQGGSGSHLTASGNPIETSGTITINIDEGYSIPSDNEQTAWDGKAADLKAEIDSSTYVLTLQLKDSAGNLIGTAKTIDLPLETMVVDGEYDSQTKKIKLELKNGNYVEFSVADLVSGLQTELSASNKLDPDYIDYDSTHRAVTDTEKDTWNGKQNALTFDDTPTQNSNNPVKSGGIYTALTGKQASLDSTQLAAVNSGIDSTKVGQISTNQSNILYALETGAANYAPLEGDNRSGSGYFLDATNSGMKVFTSGTVMHVYCEYTKTTNTQFSIQFTNASGNVIASTSLYAPSASASGTISGDVTLSQDVYGYNAYYNGASGNTCAITNVMICPKNVWDAIQKYIPYSLPNYDLTRLEAEDRASLAEVVDSGAKNILDLPSLDALKASNSSGTWSNNVYTLNNVTFTVDTANKTISTSGTASAVTQFIVESINAESTKYSGLILSGCPSGGDYDNGYSLFTTNNSLQTVEKDTGDGVLIGSTAIRYIIIMCRNGTNMSGKVFKPMITTKAAFGVSNKFVPYRPNYDLVCNSVIDLNDMISSFIVNSSKSVSIKSRRATSFTMLMFGFVQTIGKVHWYIESNTSTSVSVIDAITGSAVSQSVISFAYSESSATLTISSNTSGNSNFVLIRSAY